MRLYDKNHEMWVDCKYPSSFHSNKHKFNSSLDFLSPWTCSCCSPICQRVCRFACVFLLISREDNPIRSLAFYSQHRADANDPKWLRAVCGITETLGLWKCELLSHRWETTFPARPLFSFVFNSFVSKRVISSLSLVKRGATWIYLFCLSQLEFVVK